MLTSKIFVIQPTSLCNLNCNYCYISEENRKNSAVMSEHTLEAIISKILSSKSKVDYVLLNWHAGEPLTAGIDFYRKAISFIDIYNHNNIKIEQSIQTNGLLINEQWCEFIKNNKIGIGVSIDGPRFIHNANRVNWNGKGSFDKVIKGIQLLQKNDIPFHALMVLTENCLDYAEEVYNFFIEYNISSIGFNVEEKSGDNGSSSLEDVELKERYKKFIKRLSELWLQNPKKLNIREFERATKNILKAIQDDKFSHFQIESSKNILTIKKNGDIVPFTPEMASGTKSDPNYFVIDNIHNISNIDEIFLNNKFISMDKLIQSGINTCRNTCQYFQFCGGGNPGNKYYEKNTFDCTETNFCRYHYQYITDVFFDNFKKISESESLMS